MPLFPKSRFKSSCLRVLAGICICLISAGCAQIQKAGPTPARAISDIKDLRLGLPESAFRRSADLFQTGLLPDKTRNDTVYKSRSKDEYGGTYCARVVDGKCYDVIIEYSTRPVSREIAAAKLNRLFPPDRGRLTEHDQTELQLDGLEEPWEFFYFGKRYGAEFGYRTNQAEKRVFFVHAWQNADYPEDKLAQNAE